jgi:cytochrome c-type biogenesis protein CcmH
MLGWSYFETGDLMRSAQAYRRAAQIEPNNAENWSSLGEALQVASTTVSPEAKTAFERADRDRRQGPARALLPRRAEGSVRPAPGSVDDWIALLKDTPAGAPWEADLRRTITQVAEKQKIDVKGRMPAPQLAAAWEARPGSVATAGIPGPTPEQLAAASSIPPSQQDEMVQGMVSRLANRLKANPKDADGWIRLMRARMVLGETGAAQDALRSGRAAFQGDAATQSAGPGSAGAWRAEWRLRPASSPPHRRFDRRHAARGDQDAPGVRGDLGCGGIEQQVILTGQHRGLRDGFDFLPSVRSGSSASIRPSKAPAR